MFFPLVLVLFLDYVMLPSYYMLSMKCQQIFSSSYSTILQYLRGFFSWMLAICMICPFQLHFISILLKQDNRLMCFDLWISLSMCIYSRLHLQGNKTVKKRNVPVIKATTLTWYWNFKDYILHNLILKLLIVDHRRRKSTLFIEHLLKNVHKHWITI